MSRVQRVLAIGAHPDDVEIGCGGTLALYRKMGAEVVMASICSGDKGSRDLSCAETTQVRRQESEAAAGAIGATYTCLGEPDSELFENCQTRAQVIELIRKSRPDVILTHSPDDYHADHRTTSILVTYASYSATSFRYETESPPLERAASIIHMDNHLGVDFLPEELVDISKVIDVKKEMIRQHQSQFAHLKERAGEDLLDDAVLLARLRGRQSGVEFAEGFQPCRAYLQIRTYRLLP